MISIYFGATSKGCDCSNANIQFAAYLARLVDKEVGPMGQYSGWDVGSFLNLNTARFKAEGSQDQHEKSAGDKSEGDKDKDKDKDKDQDQDGDEDKMPPPPPPSTVKWVEIPSKMKSDSTSPSYSPVEDSEKNDWASCKSQKATPNTAPNTSNPLRRELQSSKSARRKDPLEVDKLEMDGQPQCVMLYDTFLDMLEWLKGTSHQSPQEWSIEVCKKAREHAKL